MSCRVPSLGPWAGAFPAFLASALPITRGERPSRWKAARHPCLSPRQVKLLEVMEGVDKETFEFKFGKELTFTTVLSDQQVVELVPGGTGIVVEYEDRSRFIQLVQKARLEESKEQVGKRERRALPLTARGHWSATTSALMLASTMTVPLVPVGQRVQRCPRVP